MKTALVIGCLLAVPVLGLGIVLRRAAHERLEHTLGDADLDALLAMAPPLDPELQARLWAWMLDTEGWPGGWSTSLDEDWYLAGEPRPPGPVVEEHERLRSDMDELTARLRTDRACLTSVCWLEPLFALERDAFDGYPLRLPSLGKTVAAARWYAYEVMVAVDPTPALEDLQRLGRALSHSGTVIDRMCARGVNRIRSRTFLRLRLRGEAPQAMVRAWIEEPSHEIQRLVEDVHMSRIRYAATVGRDVDQGRWLARNADLDLEARARWWWRGAGDVAAWLELCRAFEGYLRHEVPAEEVRRREGERLARSGRPIASADLHASYLEQALRANAMHRLPRVAASVLGFREDEGRLPSDEAELRAWMGPSAVGLDAAPFALGLRYERRSPDRFGIHMDPGSPLPALLTSEARERLREALPAPGREAVIRWNASHVLELLVPAP